MEVSFRKAIPEDAAIILEFINQMRQVSDTVYFDSALYTLSSDQLADQLAVIYESTEHLFLIAKTTECLGVVTIQKITSEIGEVGVAVAPAYQNMQIGSILVEEALEWLQLESTLTQVGLSVLKENRSALHLYEKFGFHYDLKMAKILPQVPFEAVTFMSLKK
ncbi:N-acetyltransferase family protein [Enterococcus bulliens]